MSSKLNPIQPKSKINLGALKLTSELDAVSKKSRIRTAPIQLVSEIQLTPLIAGPETNIGMFAVENNGTTNIILMLESETLPAYDTTGALRPIPLKLDSILGVGGYALPACDYLGNIIEIPLITKGQTLIYLPTATGIQYDYTDIANPLKAASVFKPTIGPPPGGYPTVFVIGGGLQPYTQTEVPSWFTDVTVMPFLLVQAGYAVIWLSYIQEDYPAPEKLFQRCIQYFREQSATYSLDPTRFAVYGYREGATIAAYTAFGPDAKLTSGETFPEELQSTRLQNAILEEGTHYWPAMVEVTTGAHFGQSTLATVDISVEEASSPINLVDGNPGINDSMYCYLLSMDTPGSLITTEPFITKVLTDIGDAWHVLALHAELIQQHVSHSTETLKTTGLYDPVITYPLVVGWLGTKL